ncbi:MAG: NADH-quinone oxidoreductase subunit NuoE [Armatimonadota bacterium]
MANGATARRPGASALSDAARQEIARLAGLYEHRQSALLPALFVAQREAGYLPPWALEAVADALDLPLTEVTSVASFYSLLYLEPVGRHVIQCCTNLSCMLNGCGAVVARFQERLGTAPGGTTADGRFTLRTVECLAACEEAPAVIIDEERWARVSPDGVDGLLARYP